jgi:hypothetical protein
MSSGVKILALPVFVIFLLGPINMSLAVSTQKLSLENIRNQLGQLLHQLNTPTPAVAPANIPPPPIIAPQTSTSTSSSHRLKPAFPSEFFGE